MKKIQTKSIFNEVLLYFQFPTMEECDFDLFEFLFDEHVAISHHYDLKKVSLKS